MEASELLKEANRLLWRARAAACKLEIMYFRGETSRRAELDDLIDNIQNIQDWRSAYLTFLESEANER